MTRFKQHTTLDPGFVAAKLEEFFAEDNVLEDITTLSTQEDYKQVRAILIAKESLVFAGSEIIKQGFSDCTIEGIEEDGAILGVGDIIAAIHGSIDTILKKERVILNLIQRLSGIASTTHKISQITNQHNIELLDTRKTTPGLRMFEKFAVVTGGGTNHRFSLKTAVMIKDNHLIGSPDINATVARAKQKNPNKVIQLEVNTREQLEEALKSEITSILLDNFNPTNLSNVIQHIRSHPKGQNMYIELSGGITDKTISDFCIKGVDGISMGALTHNIKSKDISLDIK